MRRTHSGKDTVFELWKSPIGWIGLVAGEQGLVEIVSHPDAEEVRRRVLEKYPDALREEGGVIGTALMQLGEYFRGVRRAFDLPFDCRNLSPFTATVLRILAELPYGDRITYGQLAARAGRPGAARAVGRAMAVNLFPIVVPCHRVVGAGGRMTGYSGGEGIATKEWLLDFENECRDK